MLWIHIDTVITSYQDVLDSTSRLGGLHVTQVDPTVMDCAAQSRLVTTHKPGLGDRECTVLQMYQDIHSCISPRDVGLPTAGQQRGQL